MVLVTAVILTTVSFLALNNIPQNLTMADIRNSATLEMCFLPVAEDDEEDARRD